MKTTTERQNSFKIQEIFIKAKIAVEKVENAVELFKNLTPIEIRLNLKLLNKYQFHLNELTKHLSQEKVRFVATNDVSNKAIIEVGSLEWVIQQMEEDTTGLWSEIIFIPPGFIKRNCDRK